MSETRIKIPQSRLADAAFLMAFRNLCAETSLSINDRFRLARASRLVGDWTSAFDTRRNDLVRKLGTNRRAWLAERIAKEENAGIKGALALQLQDCAAEDMIIPTGTPAAMEFDTAMKAETEGALELLAEKIKLGPDCKLTAADLAELLDLVEPK